MTSRILLIGNWPHIKQQLEQMESSSSKSLSALVEEWKRVPVVGRIS